MSRILLIYNFGLCFDNCVGRLSGHAIAPMRCTSVAHSELCLLGTYRRLSLATDFSVLSLTGSTASLSLCGKQCSFSPHSPQHRPMVGELVCHEVTRPPKYVAPRTPYFEVSRPPDTLLRSTSPPADTLLRSKLSSLALDCPPLWGDCLSGGRLTSK